MAIRLNERFTQRAADTFVGRGDELRRILDGLRHGAQRVWWVHGVAGIGKSSLLGELARRAREVGLVVVTIDGGAMEPSTRGFLREVCLATGGDDDSAPAAVARLATLGNRVLLIIDGYDAIRAIDPWLRREFVPALPPHVALAIASREPPSAAWSVSPGWSGLVERVPLDTLPEPDALSLLARVGIPAAGAERINRFAMGHPLALVLAASLTAWGSRLDMIDSAHYHVVETLTRVFLAEVRDERTRLALEAASVVRRTTHGLLAALLPDSAPRDLYDRLAALPFIEPQPDGLRLHDAVQHAIASSLRAANPELHRDYRRRAWAHLRAELGRAGAADLWRWTADTLFLIEQPVLREAFFPRGAQHFTIERARPDHGPAILAITDRHDGPQSVEVVRAWWQSMPAAFHIVRSPEGEVAGFFCAADQESVPPRVLDIDPLARAWLDHQRQEPLRPGQTALWLRRWLSAEHGEAMCPEQGAYWLEAKRMYVERRPRLGRMYGTLRDITPLLPTVQEVLASELTTTGALLDGVHFATVMIDFGPGSVDGWLARILSRELGVLERQWLDTAARELIGDGRRVSLTPLEFGVFRLLSLREGRVVSRETLLDEVWGRHYEGGSNVVDVVIRSLRRKLGNRAGAIETVWGVGYRFRSGSS